jgi:MYXO-CTERM domain-containing protein
MKIRCLPPLAVVSGALTAAAANADVLRESFDNGIPSSWSRQDYRSTGSSIAWGVNTDTGRGNYTGGAGRAAMADSDFAGDGIEFDIALLTPTMHLPARGDLALTFQANYQNFAGSDFADVDLDAGSGWVNLLRWNEDHGDSFFQPIGENVSLDLGAYAGSDVRVRFHYYDPGTSDWDWYWQVDNVTVTPAPGSFALGLLGAIMIAPRRRRH